MNTWFIDITLKGSGVKLNCRYDGPEDNSSDVIVKIFDKKPPNEMLALRSDNNKHQIFIIAGEIAAIDIYQQWRLIE